MRVTFILLRRGYVRNFAGCIEGLLARGHQVHLGFDMPDHSPTGIEERLAERYSGLTWDATPRRKDRWCVLLVALRGMIDAIRYFHPDYRGATTLQERFNKKVKRQVSVFYFLLHALFAIRSARWVKLAIRALNWIQFKLPTDKTIRDYLAEKAPDVVMVTPLIDFASRQVDHVEAANRLGIPTIAPIASWDNLTNKGLLRCRLDRVLVWNQPQRQEAERYHYIPADRITVTGAHTFDRWLGREPKRSHEAFLDRVGLRPGSEFIVFVCSSGFIARREEATFVREWIAAIRASGDARLRDLGILVRPHFQNAGQWEDQDLSDLGNAVVYPRAGANPVTPDSVEDYFDTLYFSRAVVGLNTTAMVEAGLIGRPVLSLETDQFSGTQSGSLHFRHLREGGLLKHSTTMEAHLGQLGETLAQPPGPDANRAFVDYFIRCPDASRSATELMVHEIEAVAAMKKAPLPVGPSDWLVSGLLFPLATALRAIKRYRKHRRERRQARARAAALQDTP